MTSPPSKLERRLTYDDSIIPETSPTTSLATVDAESGSTSPKAKVVHRPRSRITYGGGETAAKSAGDGDDLSSDPHNDDAMLSPTSGCGGSDSDASDGSHKKKGFVEAKLSPMGFVLTKKELERIAAKEAKAKADAAAADDVLGGFSRRRRESAREPAAGRQATLSPKPMARSGGNIVARPVVRGQHCEKVNPLINKACFCAGLQQETGSDGIVRCLDCSHLGADHVGFGHLPRQPEPPAATGSAAVYGSEESVVADKEVTDDGNVSVGASAPKEPPTDAVIAVLPDGVGHEEEDTDAVIAVLPDAVGHEEEDTDAVIAVLPDAVGHEEEDTDAVIAVLPDAVGHEEEDTAMTTTTVESSQSGAGGTTGVNEDKVAKSITDGNTNLGTEDTAAATTAAEVAEATEAGQATEAGATAPPAAPAPDSKTAAKAEAGKEKGKEAVAKVGTVETEAGLVDENKDDTEHNSSTNHSVTLSSTRDSTMIGIDGDTDLSTRVTAVDSSLNLPESNNVGDKGGDKGTAAISSDISMETAGISVASLKSAFEANGRKKSQEETSR